MEYALAVLVGLLGHDRQIVRETAHAALVRANNALDFRLILERERGKTKDAEIARRLDRILGAYKIVYPHIVAYHPRFNSLSVAKGYVTFKYDMALNDYNDENWKWSGAAHDGFSRLYTSRFLENLFDAGWTRWEVQFYLDRAILYEIAQGIFPSRRIFVHSN
jgi:hypothetical protein